MRKKLLSIALSIMMVWTFVGTTGISVYADEGTDAGSGYDISEGTGAGDGIDNPDEGTGADNGIDDPDEGTGAGDVKDNPSGDDTDTELFTSLVELSADNFPSKAFRDELAKYDKDSDGCLSDVEISNVKRIALAYKNIMTLQGIELLTSVTSIDVKGNNIQKLDLRKNHALLNLNCSRNGELTSVNVSGLANLNRIECFQNPELTELNVNGCSQLKILNAHDSSIVSIDLSSCVNLQQLNLAYNDLNSINISKCSNLTWLSVKHNHLEVLKVNNNPKLRTLNCSENMISSLNIINTSLLSEMPLDEKPLFVAGCDIDAEDDYHSVYVCCTADQKKCYDSFWANYPHWQRLMQWGVKMQAGHKMKTVVLKKATFSAAGKIQKQCVCGKKGSITTVKKVSRIRLSKSTFVYTGKVQKPVVTVKNSAGNKLVKGTNFSVTYSRGCKAVGKYKITVKGKTKYAFTKTFTFKIKPKKPVISSVTSGDRRITVEMKTTVGATGGGSFKIAYKVNGSSTWKYVKTTSQSEVLKDLKRGKKYSVKVCAVKKVGSTTYTSPWTSVKTSAAVK